MASVALHKFKKVAAREGSTSMPGTPSAIPSVRQKSSRVGILPGVVTPFLETPTVGKLFRAVTIVIGTAVLAGGAVACTSAEWASERVDDSVIKASVRAKLAGYSRFSTLANITVDSTNGVVTLGGRVGSLDEQCIAMKITTLVSGVRGINNDLQVKTSAP